MIELLAGLGRTLGFSFAAGINLYATVAILGLASRYGWVSLPDQYRVFDNDLIIGAALTMYAIEFFADKIPWVDSIWDAVHTVIRPLGGALIAVQTLGDASPATEDPHRPAGRHARGRHAFTKAGTRAVANTSPEPFSNWVLSLRRRPLRGVARIHRPQVPARRRPRGHRRCGDDAGLRDVDCACRAPAVARREAVASRADDLQRAVVNV